MNSVITDSELVEQSRRGDRNAFRDLVLRYENRVYHLALKMVRDPQDAEDVLQETFISIYRHLDSFREESQFSTWVYRIAANASLMKLRARRPVTSLDEPPSEAENVDQLPHELLDWSETPEEALLSSEMRTEMDRALAELPETLRVVFVLRDMEGLSIEETARVLEITEPNVKTRLHRARLALRERLAEYLTDRNSAER